MYNIALCFYGEPRNWDLGSQTIKNFNTELPKEQFKIDVYFHLWDNITKKITRENLYNLIKQKENLETKCVIESNLKHKELLDLYKPINYKIENKNILNEYVDKFKPKNDWMGTEEIKQAIKYSNSPCFSQFYSMSQCYDVVKTKEKYNLIFILKTDCLLKSKKLQKTIIEYIKRFQKQRTHLWVDKICLRPGRKETWLWHGLMLGTSDTYNRIFTKFPKIPIGMGTYSKNRHIYTYGGNSHAEFADYILNHTNIPRVWAINSRLSRRFNLFTTENTNEI